jgi:hypothetical protein
MLGGTQTQKGWEPLPALTYLDFLRILIYFNKMFHFQSNYLSEKKATFDQGNKQVLVRKL